jgi:hypothetical protein
MPNNQPTPADRGPLPPSVPQLPENPLSGTSQTHAGVQGQSNSGPGVQGLSLGQPGSAVGNSLNDGVYGSGANGVHGVVDLDTGNGNGVLGEGGAGTGVMGTSTGGTGVLGRGSGVWGDNTGTGLGVTGTGGGCGVKGQSNTGVGVYGRAAQDLSLLPIGPSAPGTTPAPSEDINYRLPPRAGVSGESDTSPGVYGRSAATVVSATAPPPPPRAGVTGESDTSPGVYGGSQSFDAVVGETSSNAHAGVTGRNLTTTGGVGVYGVGGQYAGKFDGAVQVNGNADVTGTLNANGDAHVTGTMYAKVDVVLGSDCAEDFDVAPMAEVEPGTVMILSDNGALRMSQCPYDKKVAGVISGAGDYKPGLILGRSERSQKRMPLALLGKVYCKVDAQYAPVGVGDLLTTSPTPGHAMRVVDPLKAFGAVIGKALRPLQSGTGLVPILVTLQ